VARPEHLVHPVPLWLGVMRPAMASTVHCTTREDHAFKRLITTCSDSSRAVTRDDERFKRCRTEVITPGAADTAMEKTGRWYAGTDWSHMSWPSPSTDRLVRPHSVQVLPHGEPQRGSHHGCTFRHTPHVESRYQSSAKYRAYHALWGPSSQPEVHGRPCDGDDHIIAVFMCM
jgi:hypothetical protein